MIYMDEEGEYVSLNTFYLDAYTEEEILFFTGLLVDAKHPLRHIEEYHQDQLLCSFRFPGYNYTCGMMSVARQANGNPADTRKESILDRTDLLPTLRDGFVLPTMDGWHRSSCVIEQSSRSDQA